MIGLVIGVEGRLLSLHQHGYELLGILDLHGIGIGVQHEEAVAMLHQDGGRGNGERVRAEYVVIVHRDQLAVSPGQEILLGHCPVKAEIAVSLEFIDIHMTIIA